MQRLDKIFNEYKDYVLMNTIYERTNDVLTMVFKDTKSGDKKMVSLNEPKNRVFITKEKKPKEWKLYEDRKNLDEIYVRNKYKEGEIAKRIGIKNFWDNVREGKLNVSDIYLSKRLYSAYIDLEDNVIRAYSRFHTKRKENGMFKSNYPVLREFHIGGLDIETDINVSDNIDEQPVIVNTYVDAKMKKVFSYCLINPEYKGQKEVMEDLDSFYKELKEFLIEHVNKISFGNSPSAIEKAEQVKKILLPIAKEITCDIKFTTKEEEVIGKVNNIVFSNINPDFLLIYNAQFDICHQMKRYDKLGYSPDSLFRFKDANMYSYVNIKNQNMDFSKRIHYFDFRNPTKVIDQMLLYYQLRKGKNFAKYSLDATANREIGVGKLDYTKICNYIGDFPYVDYKMFLIYNIVDVLSMIFLDKITQDLFAVTYKRFKATVEWNKISKSMDRTSAVFDFYPELDDKIQGCNINPLLIDLDKANVERISKNNPGLKKVIKQLKKTANSDREKNPYRIEGGLVTTPNNISDRIKSYEIYKIPIKNYNKFKNLIDYDATSMYPSNKQVNNSSKDTLIGKIQTVNGYTDNTLARRVALSIINQNIGSIGSLLFNLPDVHKIINDYHKLNPIVSYDKDARLIDTKEVDLSNITDKETKKIFKDLKTLFRTCYNTNYNDKDAEGGRPSKNKLFFLSSKNKIEFSYYSTKVQINTEIPTSELIGYNEKGILCGTIAKDIIHNMNDEYKEFLIPKKDEFKEKLIYSGELSDEQIDGILNAKKQVYNLKINEYSVFLLNRVLFFSDKSLNKKIKYEIYDIEEDDNLFKLKLIYNGKIGKTPLTINQSIIAYRK